MGASYLKSFIVIYNFFFVIFNQLENIEAVQLLFLKIYIGVVRSMNNKKSQLILPKIDCARDENAFILIYGAECANFNV